MTALVFPPAPPAPAAPRWRVLSTPIRYEAVARWEERVGGKVTRTVVVKQLTLSSTREGDFLRVVLATAPPVLRKPDPTPLEEVVLRLAALYQRLVLDTSAAGDIVGLVNHAEIVQTWAALKPALVTRYGAEDELMAFLLASVEDQVRDPALLLASLRHDYLYALLLANRGPGDARGAREGPAVCFPSFLAEADVWFAECRSPPLGAGTGPVGSQVHGRLDEARTDRAALAAALAPADQPAPDPATLNCTYRAAHDLDPATGWPVRVDATVTCASPAGDAKEYDLTLQQL